MTSRISKGSITGRKAFSNGGLGLSIGSRVSGGIRQVIGRRAPDAIKIASAVAPADPISSVLYKFVGVDVGGTISEEFAWEAVITTGNTAILGDFVSIGSVTLTETSLNDHMFLHGASKISNLILTHTNGNGLGNQVSLNISGAISSDITTKFITKTSTPNVYDMTFPSDLVFSKDNDEVLIGTYNPGNGQTEGGKNTNKMTYINGITITFDQTYDNYNFEEGEAGSVPDSTGPKDESSAIAELIDLIKGKAYKLTMVRDNVFKILSPLTSVNNNVNEFSHNGEQ